MGNSVSLSRSRGRVGLGATLSVGCAGVRLDLDKGIRRLIGCYSKAEALAGFGGDAVGSPARLVDDFYVGAADGFEGGEAVLDLSYDLLFGGVAGRSKGERDMDAVTRRNAGDASAGSVGVGRD